MTSIAQPPVVTPVDKTVIKSKEDNDQTGKTKFTDNSDKAVTTGDITGNHNRVYNDQRSFNYNPVNNYNVIRGRINDNRSDGVDGGVNNNGRRVIRDRDGRWRDDGFVRGGWNGYSKCGSCGDGYGTSDGYPPDGYSYTRDDGTRVTYRRRSINNSAAFGSSSSSSSSLLSSLLGGGVSGSSDISSLLLQMLLGGGLNGGGLFGQGGCNNPLASLLGGGLFGGSPFGASLFGLNPFGSPILPFGGGCSTGLCGSGLPGYGGLPVPQPLPLPVSPIGYGAPVIPPIGYGAAPVIGNPFGGSLGVSPYGTLAAPIVA